MKGTALRQSFAKGGKRHRAAMHLIPNLFTTGNLFCGVFAVLSVFNANYMAAAIAILVAMIFDVLDGKSARMTNSTSHFGLEYDSLSDVVSDRKSTRLNSSHMSISYAVFCLKKKKK